MTRRRRPQSGRFPSVGPCGTSYTSNCLLFNINYSKFSISFVLTVGKVPGRAHASAADRRRARVTLTPLAPKNRPKIDQKSIENLIIFRYRFWTDLGSFWGPNLASFSAFVAPKLGQVRSKTRFESLAASKT